MFLIFDTETTGLPIDYNAPISDSANWPRMVQLAWQVHGPKGELIEVKNYIIKPEDYQIPYDVVKIHGITTERAIEFGVDISVVLEEFSKSAKKCQFLVGHNVSFDNNILGAEYFRKNTDSPIEKMDSLDTKDLSVEYCALPGGRGGKYKWPKLAELHIKLFGKSFEAAHNAAADVEATSRCFLELVRIGIIGQNPLKMSSEAYQNFIDSNPKQIQAIGLNTQPYNPNDIPISAKDKTEIIVEPSKTAKPINVSTKIPQFTHLHLHTQYSILDGMTKTKNLVKKAKKDGMKAVAITDHGNMFGVKEFHQTMTKEGIKPIIGMEAYMAFRSHLDKEKVDSRRYHLVLLAKNEIGYKNLMKLSSIGFSDGFYYKPRIDRELLIKHKEGLIASSACLGGEINQKLMGSTVEEAEKSLLELKEIFGDDFYLELQRHRATDPQMNNTVYPDQIFVNKHLIELAAKHQVKYIATNDVHYLNEEDASAHDLLVCLNTGRDIDDPDRMRYTGQEWFKTREEMSQLFGDLPEAISNTQEIVNKVEQYPLDHDPIMPDFIMPPEFTNENEYLKHITYEGAYKRWGQELLPDTIERLEFELSTIEKMGFPGYFLIVWDFLKAAREMGVSVGPGRGSAAGSAVAYSLKITEIDPLKYNLLFERFLNPDRISMPDIDIDFDDEGRDKVLQWVKEKYGAKRVAHLITFGSMAAKSSIRDVARVQKFPLSEADRLAKMVPERPGITLVDSFKEVAEFKLELTHGNEASKSVLDFAQRLEGSVRNTGTHACGVIISKLDLDNYVPITHVKDSVLEYATQYDGHYVESIGLLKMDFLGLKTLTIIKDALLNIKISQDKDIDIDSISLEDNLTYELYSKGETSGLFQFESDGMKKHLRNLKPTKFEDLIAMNALYRPGPMEYIESFIARKNGKEKIEYDLAGMEDFLDETYGITVYQEQVMLLSRKLANFTRGQSDSLRKAMGKKIKSMMDELKILFLEGCEKNGHDLVKVEKVWKDWEAFAKYAFNKSHATCYSYVSYQTAYLKANYPAEFMASVLSHELKDIKKLNLYLNECNRMGLKVMGPNINESYSNFTVNTQGELRYGMAGIKGVGEAAVDSITNERETNGNFKDIFDFITRVNLRSVNKRAIEALAMAGAFDELQADNHRAQFMADYNESENFIERLIKHGNRIQLNENSAQASLFGEMEEVQIKNPEFPICDPWSNIKKLNLEKDLIGFYLSGHPLDIYDDTISSFKIIDTTAVEELISNRTKQQVRFAGIVTKAQVRESASNGNKFGFYTIEDKSGTIEVALFTEMFLKYNHLLQLDNFVFVQGSIKDSYRDNTKCELKIDDIMMLDSIMNHFTNSIKIQMKVENLNQDFLKEFTAAIKENPGKVKLQFFIQDQAEQLEMSPKKLKVSADGFLKTIKKWEHLNYKIN